MTTTYCPNCGTPHECASSAGGTSDAVEIARIEANRDIKVAQLARSAAALEADTAVELAEVNAAAQVEVATVEAEAGVEAADAVVDALTPDPPAEAPAPEAQAVVVDDEPDDAPPARDDSAKPHEPAAPARSKGFF